MFRRPIAPCARFLTAATAVTVAAQSRQFDLTTATVADAQAAMDARTLTSERLVQLCLAD